MKQTQKVPRGIRNCNPLNIRIGNTWMGERNNPDDNEFEQFVSMEYGIRAAFVILRRYIRRYQLNTVELIISQWAPSNENNTKAYIDRVCQSMKIDPNTPIQFEDKKTMCSLVAAMAKVENGQAINDVQIAKGYDMA